MEVSAREIRDLADERGFNVDMLERMVRLFDVLDSFASDDVIAPRMALKGGTALNAFHAPLPRLSVDIDINYVGELDWSRMQDDKRKFEDRLVGIMASKGYRQVYAPPKGRGKWRFSYPDIAGKQTTLLMDLIYRERVPLFGVNTLSSPPLGKYVARDVPVLDVHEVVGAKLKALVSREKSRDLFDADFILGLPDLDWRKIKHATLVLGAWQYRGDWREVSTDQIDGNMKELRRNLLDCLPRGHFDSFGSPERWLHDTVNRCRRELAPVFEFTEGERAFLNDFLDRGRIDPGHLATGAETEAAINAYPALRGMAEAIRKGEFKVIGLAAQERRLSDNALRLACAVTERIETSAGFHWGDLPDKIKERLNFAESRRNVPADAVGARAAEIARKRAEADLRVGAARTLRGASIHEFRARYKGNAKFSMRHKQKRYERLVDEGMQKLAREGVQPTDLEVAAARTEVASQGTRYEASCRVLSEALELGTVAEAADIRAERQALSSELAKPMKDLKTFEKVRLLERLFRSCTVSEIRDMSVGRGPLLEVLPDETARSQAAVNSTALLSASVAGPAPWK